MDEILSTAFVCQNNHVYYFGEKIIMSGKWTITEYHYIQFILIAIDKTGHMSSRFLRWSIIPSIRVACTGLKVAFVVCDSVFSPASESDLVLTSHVSLCRNVQNFSKLASICSRSGFLIYAVWCIASCPRSGHLTVILAIWNVGVFLGLASNVSATCLVCFEHRRLPT